MPVIASDGIHDTDVMLDSIFTALLSQVDLCCPLRLTTQRIVDSLFSGHQRALAKRDLPLVVADFATGATPEGTKTLIRHAASSYSWMRPPKATLIGTRSSPETDAGARSQIGEIRSE